MILPIVCAIIGHFMTKECWQLKVVDPTPCFKKAGRAVCANHGCPLSDRLEQLKERGVEVDSAHLRLLLHSTCRISSLSADNFEFLKRIKQIKSNT